MKRPPLISILLSLVMVYWVFSCIPPAEVEPENPFLMDLKEDTDLSKTGNALPYFATYVQGLKITGLEDIFEETGPFTVFIPRVEAFERYFNARQIIGIEAMDQDELETLLLYHIVPGRRMTFELNTGYYPTMATDRFTGNSVSLYINREGRLLINQESIFGTSDIESDNGIIHSMTGVIEVPNMMRHLEMNTEFKTFLKLWKEEVIKMEEEGLINNDHPYTVLAPASAAFEKYLSDESEWENLEDLPETLKTNIIRHHIIPEKNILMKDLYQDETFVSAAGQPVIIVLNRNTRFPQIMQAGDEIRFLESDIQATDGVIHLISHVLIPHEGD